MEKRKIILKPKPYSLVFVFILIMLITLLIYMVSPIVHLQDSLFLLYGLPIFYVVIVYTLREGLLLSVFALAMQIGARWNHFGPEVQAGDYMAFLLKGVIEVGLYLISCNILANLVKRETVITDQYKTLAEELASTSEELKTANINITTLYVSTIKALAAAIEAKDQYTSGHSERVTKYALAIAVELGLEEEEVQQVTYASILHDIGKIGVSEDILGKKGKLEPEEFKKIQQHTTIGANIISSISMLESIIPIIIHHHEAYDGKGYPFNKKDGEIPLGARIIAVADAYDAMTSDRPYRKAMSKEDAIIELRKCSGTQFDPKIVDAFLKTL